MTISVSFHDATDPANLAAMRETVESAVSEMRESPVPAETAVEPGGSSELPDENPVVDDAEPDDIVVDPHLATLPLELPDLTMAADEVMASGHYRREDVIDAIVALSLGNLMLSGPPGTGKTTLAQALAAAFNVRLETATANPEWSVYDVIGAQTLRDRTIGYRHGCVTQAVLDCYRTMRDEDEGTSDYQAVWLLLDEINRAEIDRAFGSLFTALSGGSERLLTLDYLPRPQQIAIPLRFRIIAPFNSFDTSFVNRMSAALRRRFARVSIREPENDTDGGIPSAELSTCLNKAVAEVKRASSDVARADAARAEMTARTDDLRKVFGAFRRFEGNKGIPVGTAQVIDTCAYAMMWMLLEDAIPATTSASSSSIGSSGPVAGHGPMSSDEFWRIFDRALVARLANSLESDNVRGALDVTFLEAFLRRFPGLANTHERLTRFLDDVD